jgi:hypothetical protein
MRFVTVATDDQGYFRYLLKSCKRHGIHLDVLGWGQKWRGFNWRIGLLIDYLSRMPRNEIVCFVDAYDVVILEDALKFEVRFLDLCAKYKTKFIVGSENPQSWTNGIVLFIARLCFGTCKDQLPNAGTYMGRAKDLLEMLGKFRQVSVKDDADDQMIMTTVCSKFPGMMHVDKKNELFMTFCSPFKEIRLKVVDERVVLDDGTKPCLLHANGNTRIDGVLRDLGYDVPEAFVRYMNGYQRKTLTKKTIYYGKTFVPWILAIAVAVYLARMVMTTNA